MKENEKKKTAVQVTEGRPVSGTGTEAGGMGKEHMKKVLIFGSMALIFVVCLYLIFSGDGREKANEGITNGLNTVLPEASGGGLPTDKGKAYEQEMLREKERQKRATIMTLSDYWQSDSIRKQQDKTEPIPEDSPEGKTLHDADPALRSYRTMQHSLGNFYQHEDRTLQTENEKLKAQLEAVRSSPVQGPEDRLALMEQSYRMAAKYFPGATKPVDSLTDSTSQQQGDTDFLPVVSQRRSVVSQLYRRVPDSAFLARLVRGEQQTFTTVQREEGQILPATSIRACVNQSLKLVGEGMVPLRLLQDARIGNAVLPRGTVLTATGKFRGNRLNLQVVSVEVDGSIVPVELNVYDLDGQKGLNLPYAPEVTAVNGTLANMGNTGGSSFTLNRSAGQQLTSDMTRGLIQGVSGYFSKKVTAQKATLKQGYQVFLVSKQQ